MAVIPAPVLAEASRRKAEEEEEEKKKKRRRRHLRTTEEEEKEEEHKKEKKKITRRSPASAQESVVEDLLLPPVLPRDAPLPPAPSQPRSFSPPSTSSSMSLRHSSPSPSPSPSSLPAAAAPPSPSSPLSITRPRVFSSSDFEGWQPQHLLGRGSYGAVYKGILRDGCTIACCKVIELTPEGNEAELHRLHMEVALMKQLYHPNVVQYYGSLEEHQTMSTFMSSSRSVVASPPGKPNAMGMSTTGSRRSGGGGNNGNGRGGVPMETDGKSAHPPHASPSILAPSSSSSLPYSSPLSTIVSSSAAAAEGSTHESSGSTRGGGGGGGLTTFPSSPLPSSSFSSPKTSALAFSRLTIFMEFVSGCSLNQVLKKFGPIPFATLRQWVWQMVLGVQYLHSRGIVHRDIKGANVLLSMDGVIKLVDFGCSKWLQDPSSITTTTTTNPSSRRSLSAASLPSFATAKRFSDVWNAGGNVEHGSIPIPSIDTSGATGKSVDSVGPLTRGNSYMSSSSADMYDAQGCHTLIGTPYWMAPEVICGDSGGYGLKSDIWSVGCTIVELLTGKPPWPESTSMWAAVWKIANSTGLPTEIPKNLDPELMSFLEACFERDPAKRPSAEELLQHPFLAHVTEGPAKPPEAKSMEENI